MCNSKIIFLNQFQFNSSNLLQLVTEVPLTEDALLRLHLLGLSDETPMNYANTLDVVEKMVLRSAVLASGKNLTGDPP